MRARKPRHRPATQDEEAWLTQREAILGRLLGTIQARQRATRSPFVTAAVFPLPIPWGSNKDMLRLLNAGHRGKPVPHLLVWLGSRDREVVAMPMLPANEDIRRPSRPTGRPRVPITPEMVGAELKHDSTPSDTVLALRFSARLHRPISRLVIRDRRLEWERAKRTHPRKKVVGKGDGRVF